MRMDDVPSVPLRTGLCTSSLPDGLCSVLDVLATILNSPFVLSLLGAAAGACVGAIVATRLVARRQRREELTAEIRSTNVATMVALSICHKVLSLKRTHVLPLATKFAADMAAWNEFMRQRRTGERQGNTPPPISIDLRVVASMTCICAQVKNTPVSATPDSDQAPPAKWRRTWWSPRYQPTMP